MAMGDIGQNEINRGVGFITQDFAKAMRRKPNITIGQRPLQRYPIFKRVFRIDFIAAKKQGITSLFSFKTQLPCAKVKIARAGQTTAKRMVAILAGQFSLGLVHVKGQSYRHAALNAASRR